MPYVERDLHIPPLEDPNNPFFLGHRRRNLYAAVKTFSITSALICWLARAQCAAALKEKLVVALKG
jgi:hypothetical protein